MSNEAGQKEGWWFVVTGVIKSAGCTPSPLLILCASIRKQLTGFCEAYASIE